MIKWRLSVYNVIICSINSVFCNGSKKLTNNPSLRDVPIADKTLIDDFNLSKGKNINEIQ